MFPIHLLELSILWILFCLIINYHLLINLLLCLFFHMLSQTLILKPNTYDCWRKVIQCEISTLESNQTWETILLPINKTVLGCNWVLKIKYNVDETIERYKARLEAKGYTQTEGIDYLETFSLVTKMTIIRLLLSLASIYNRELK